MTLKRNYFIISKWQSIYKCFSSRLFKNSFLIKLLDKLLGCMMVKYTELEEYRKQIHDINLKILSLLSERGYVEKKLHSIRENEGVINFDPIQEQMMLDLIVEKNEGPYSNQSIEQIFKEILKATLSLFEEDSQTLYVSRAKKSEDTVVSVNGELIGAGHPSFIFGPCSVESYEQTRKVAQAVKEKGLTFLRGGAFKPRTSPYDFQGLGLDGLKILKEVGTEFNLQIVSEIVSPDQLEFAIDYIDVIQIGARNMQNFELLKAAGRSRKPVLLKRGFAATIEEFLNAAEYIYSSGNHQIILCERGIRTFEKSTRNTLDITAVPILKRETHLPVIVDVTHSTGRKDLLLPAARAALAIGADGIMAEVHPNPKFAMSDAQQQMDLVEFDHFFKEIMDFSSGIIKKV